MEKGERVAALVAPRRRRRRAAALFMDPYAPAITDVRCWWGGVWIDRSIVDCSRRLARLVFRVRSMWFWVVSHTTGCVLCVH